MEKKAELNVKKRQVGKGTSRTLRKQGWIPSVIYGPKTKNDSFCVNQIELEKFLNLQNENTIFTFKSEDSSLNGKKVLKKDIDYHPLTRNPVHVDFYAVDLTQAVRVNVDIHFLGKAKGVTEEGGIFQETKRSVEVECLPEKIPSYFEIDISHLGLHDNVHVSDLKIDSEIKMITGLGDTLATVVEPAKEKDPAEAAAADPLKEPEAGAETAEAKPEAAAEQKEAKKEDSK